MFVEQHTHSINLILNDAAKHMSDVSQFLNNLEKNIRKKTKVTNVKPYSTRIIITKSSYSTKSLSELIERNDISNFLQWLVQSTSRSVFQSLTSG